MLLSTRSRHQGSYGERLFCTMLRWVSSVTAQALGYGLACPPPVLIKHCMLW